MIWTSAQGLSYRQSVIVPTDVLTVPVYDLTDAVLSNDPPPCNQESLTGAKQWIAGEIPEDSYVCVHYVPGEYVHGGHKDISLNILRVVVLAVPK